MDRGIKELTLSTIKDLDPRIETVVSQDIKRAIRDCKERPEEGKPRKVMLQIKITPVFEDGMCDDVNFQFFVDGKNPVRRTRLYRCGVKKQSFMPFFSPDNPEDISQPGFFQEPDGGSS